MLVSKRVRFFENGSGEYETNCESLIEKHSFVRVHSYVLFRWYLLTIMVYSWFILDGDVSNCPTGKATTLPQILSWILLRCTGKHEAAMAKKRLRKPEKQRHDSHKLHLKNGHLLVFSTNFEPHYRSSSVFMF